MSVLIDANYHTHHTLCNHATGRAKDYVEAAIACGYQILGFSDHAPSHVVHDAHVRMQFKDLPTYIADIQSAKTRYKGKIDVLTGFEIEYLDTNPNVYKSLLKHADYLILGQHYIHKRNPRHALVSSYTLQNPESVINYAKTIEKALKTGYFSFVAHPDLYLFGYPTFDQHAERAAEIICKAAKNANIPLEYNAGGLRKPTPGYPNKAFWAVAKRYNNDVIIGADAHAPHELCDAPMQQAIHEAQHLGLNIVTRLKLPKRG